LPNEFPAILQKGEIVIPKDKAKKSRRPFQPIFNVNVAAPNGTISPQSMTQLQAGLGTAIQRAMKRNT
jgi:hypothetical protein